MNKFCGVLLRVKNLAWILRYWLVCLTRPREGELLPYHLFIIICVTHILIVTDAGAVKSTILAQALWRVFRLHGATLVVSRLLSC